MKLVGDLGITVYDQLQWVHDKQDQGTVSVGWPEGRNSMGIKTGANMLKSESNKWTPLTFAIHG